MNEEEINKLEDYLKSLPKIKQNMSIPVATNIGINLDDLMNAVKRLKKVPTFDDLLKENQQLKEQLKMIKKTTTELLIYLDKNKLVLNNPNILDFYINVKKILNIEKSDK